jgi:hypothetical protein
VSAVSKVPADYVTLDGPDTLDSLDLALLRARPSTARPSRRGTFNRLCKALLLNERGIEIHQGIVVQWLLRPSPVAEKS